MAPDAASRTSAPFTIRDCALVAIATGRKAGTLEQLRDQLHDVDAGSLYHHFWGGLLQARFEEREYNNDFAAWARHALHDGVLAERLALIDPTRCPDLEALRHELLECIDTRLDEVEHLAWSRAGTPFELIRSQIVVFDTGRRLSDPRALARQVPHLSAGSVFYHFIDARRRVAGGMDDFSAWLAGVDAVPPDLLEQLAGIDPYFGSLTELRGQLARVFAEQLPEA